MIRIPSPAAVTAALLTVPNAALLGGAVQAQDARPVLVQAAHVVLAPGEQLDGADARLLIRDGKIAAVGRSIPADAAARARRVELAGATVSPGLVSLHDLLGQASDLAETIEPFTPDLRAADAFDPFGDELAERPKTGVTTVVLAPSSANTFGGIACAVKSHGTTGAVAAAELYLKIALVAESLTDDRYPTSRMGAADLIRDSFAAAKSPLGVRSPALDTLRTVLEGARPVAFHVRSHAEISTALELCAELGITPLLLECQDLEAANLERLRAAGGSVALAPLGYQSTEDALTLPTRLAAAGVRFSFVGRDGRQLRLSAALAARYGLDRTTALASLTRIPAEQAGLGERVGTLRAGRDADFLVTSGDPIDLASRLEQVWVDGILVHDTTTADGVAPAERVKSAEATR